MRIVHISDLHFGPRHWSGDDTLLIKKINSYKPDVIIDTGDSTSDGLEDEFKKASEFLRMISTGYRISIIGNHDKRNMSSQLLFKNYIYSPEIIRIQNKNKIEKQNVYLDQSKVRIKDTYTEINFLELKEINHKKFLFICIDSNELYQDNGFVELLVINKISSKISRMKYDIPILLIHHSILETNEDPLKNSLQVIDFITMHKIEYVLCGHTHEVDIRKTDDLINNHQFIQFMCGSTSSHNRSNDYNSFLVYDNLGMDNFHASMIRILSIRDRLEFVEEKNF